MLTQPMSMTIPLIGLVDMIDEVFSYGDLVLISDAASYYNEKLAVVRSTTHYCDDPAKESHPDCYTCDLIVVGDMKEISIRAKFLKKV